MASSLVYFVLPSEYAAAPESYDGRIRLGGLVETGTMRYDSSANHLSFDIWDGYVAYPVRYSGAPPELFKENTGVVVVGAFSGETFVSDEVLVKHSEVYRPAEGQQVNLDDLKNALQ